MESLIKCMGHFLNFDDWYLWDLPEEEESPCQIPLHIDLEVPEMSHDVDEEDSEVSSRVIIIDI